MWISTIKLKLLFWLACCIANHNLKGTGRAQRDESLAETRDTLRKADCWVPYSLDERRVANYICEMSDRTVGGGNDPIGFLMSSYAHLRYQRDQLQRQNNSACDLILAAYRATPEQEKLATMFCESITEGQECPQRS